MISEQVWQFHVVEGRQFDKRGAIYFAERSAEMATTLELSSPSYVRASTQGHVQPSKWMVTGTAILESAKADA